MNEWRYFGCHQFVGAGHGVYSENMRPLVPRYGSKDLMRFDGLLPSQIDTTPYLATVTRLGGWGLTALAWWDYSVDTRIGSNSIIFAPSLTISPEDLLAEAQRRFPQVFRRLPVPVTLVQENQ